MNTIERILDRFGYTKKNKLTETRKQLIKCEKELSTICESHLLSEYDIKNLTRESVIILHEGYLRNMRLLEKRLHDIWEEASRYKYQYKEGSVKIVDYSLINREDM